MKKNKIQRRQHRKHHRMFKQKYWKAKYEGWQPPDQDTCVVYVGATKNGKHFVSSEITRRQIEYILSKKSKVERNKKVLLINDISIEIRKPISLFQHSEEHKTVTIPYLCSRFSDEGMMHPEEYKNNMQEFFQSELYTTPLLNYVLDDRILRVDEDIPIADTPPVVVVTIENDYIVRIEFYMGHDKTQKKLDLRSPEIDTQNLNDSFIYKDSYDVSKNEYWMTSMIGMKLKEFQEMQEYANEVLLIDYCKIFFEKTEIETE